MTSDRAQGPVAPEDLQAAADDLERALQDPDLAGQVKDVLRHLGSAPFDPVGTPED